MNRDFLPIPDPGVKKAPDLGSATLPDTLTRNCAGKQTTCQERAKSADVKFTLAE
jgi:hypothetical protein